MPMDLDGRVNALEQAVKRQFRYTAIIIIILMATLAAVSILSLRFAAYVKDHPAVKSGA